jgi:hypothetical protein
MAITFACDTCGVEITKPTDRAGRIVRCPSCRREVLVPSAFFDPEGMKPKETPFPTPPPAPPENPNPAPPPWGLWAGGSLVVLVLGIAIGWAAFSPRSGPPPPAPEPITISPEQEASLRAGFLVALEESTERRGGPSHQERTYAWYLSLPRDEQDAYILAELVRQNEVGNAWDIIKGGYAPELPRVIRLLNEDVGTPVARKVADQLSLLLPLAAIFDYHPVNFDEGMELSERQAPMLQLAYRVNAQVKLLGPTSSHETSTGCSTVAGLSVGGDTSDCARCL